MQGMDLKGLEKAVMKQLQPYPGLMTCSSYPTSMPTAYRQAAIAATVCERLGKDYDVLFFNKMGRTP